MLTIFAVIYITLPGLGGRASLPGLTAPVAVTFGPHGVPFIRAADDADATEAPGYLHARDRLFEMDEMRRAGRGELAAWFGPRALAFDAHMRELDLAGNAAAGYRLRAGGAAGGATGAGAAAGHGLAVPPKPDGLQ
jgi:penicillin amidase